MKPPSVIMCTPNGRFNTNRRLCLSMSDFHPETWNPMWSVATILTGLFSFMLEKSPTLGSIETSDAQKKKFADDSLRYNCNENKTFPKLFPELVELYSTRVPLQAPAVTSVSGFSERTAQAGGGAAEGAWLGVNNWFVVAVAAALFAISMHTISFTFS